MDFAGVTYGLCRSHRALCRGYTWLYHVGVMLAVPSNQESLLLCEWQ